MKSVRKEWKVLLVAMVFVFGLIMIGAVSAPPVVAWEGYSKVLPIQMEYLGKNYSEWAIEWWNWVLKIPFEASPLFDGTGEFCDKGQKGPVWFLSSTLGYSDENSPVERNCTVPSGKALFFPIINAIGGALASDPPEKQTEVFLRYQTHCSSPTELVAEIDGIPIKNLYHYFEQSPVFDLNLPANNLFGTDPVVYSPSVDAGYYLFVWPLSPGKHKINWSAKWTCPFEEGKPPVPFSEDITYNLDVKKKWR
jgi:hypothetical protein